MGIPVQSNDQQVTFEWQGTRLSVKIGSHCRAIIPSYEIDRIAAWLDHTAPPIQPSITVSAYKAS